MRMARDTFARAFDQAAILPRIVALGDLDEDEIIFSEATGDLAEAALALPPAIGPLERRLLLAQLIGALGRCDPARQGCATDCQYAGCRACFG
jgi:ATP-dependent helicase/nuclease subunit B